MTSLTRFFPQMFVVSSSSGQDSLTCLVSRDLWSIFSLCTCIFCLHVPTWSVHSQSGMSELGPKWVRLAQKGGKSGTFQIRFQNILPKSDILVTDSSMWRHTKITAHPRLLYGASTYLETRMSELAPHSVRLALSGTYLGILVISLHYILGYLESPSFVSFLYQLWHSFCKPCMYEHEARVDVVVILDILEEQVSCDCECMYTIPAVNTWNEIHF